MPEVHLEPLNKNEIILIGGDSNANDIDSDESYDNYEYGAYDYDDRYDNPEPDYKAFIINTVST